MQATKDHIERTIKGYLEGHSEILFAYLFGSVVDSSSFEDVDVGVYVAELERIGDGFEYAFAMSGDLERLLKCRVDVILMNTAPDYLIHSISKGTVILNKDDDARVDFITASWSRYLDFEPKRRQWLAEVVGE